MKELPTHRIIFEDESSYAGCTDFEGMKELHILIAEDTAIYQKFAVMILEKEGFTIEIANNGEEAIEALKRDRFDLVLMDIKMPLMDGITATRIIRESKDESLDPDIPIIAVSSLAFEEDRQMCLEAGMNGFIEKPMDKHKFFREIIRLALSDAFKNNPGSKFKPKEIVRNE